MFFPLPVLLLLPLPVLLLLPLPVLLLLQVVQSLFCSRIFIPFFRLAMPVGFSIVLLSQGYQVKNYDNKASAWL